MDIDEAELIEAESKYDTFNFGAIASFPGTTKYTRININEIFKKINLPAGYGEIKVETVDSRFESISIATSYGQIRLF